VNTISYVGEIVHFSWRDPMSLQTDSMDQFTKEVIPQCSPILQLPHHLLHKRSPYQPSFRPIFG